MVRSGRRPSVTIWCRHRLFRFYGWIHLFRLSGGRFVRFSVLEWFKKKKKSEALPVAVVSYAVTSWRMTGWHHRLSWQRAALAANVDFCAETITWERMWICTCSRPGGFSGRRLRAERVRKMQHHVHRLYIDRTQLFICIWMSIPAQTSLKRAQFSMVHFQKEWHETVSMMVPLKMQLHIYIKSQHIGLGKLF